MYLVFFEICQAEGIMALPKSVNKGGGVNYLEENQRGGEASRSCSDEWGFI